MEGTENYTQSSKLVSWLILATIFLYSIVLFKSPFEGYLSYIIVVMLLPLFVLRYAFPKKMLLLYGWLMITGIFSVLAGDNESFLLLKILLNIVVSSLFYYYVFESTGGDVKYWFDLYLKGAFYVALLGIVQVVSFKVGFRSGYDFTFILNKWGVQDGGLLGIRLNSIFSEPSYFGATIAPAFFVAVYSLISRNYNKYSTLQAVIIVAAYVLTFSSVAYAGIFVTLVLLLINFGFTRYLLIAIPLVFVSYNFLYNNVFEFRTRVDGLVDLYSGKTVNALDVHGSSFVQYNNFHVAYENFKSSPVWGTGLGSHPVAFSKYSLTPPEQGAYNFNSMDANSMAYRLMSETGLFGLLFIAFFIVKFFVIRTEKNENEEHWVISAAMLVIIFLQLLRQGNYTYSGFFFFMWMYYYNAQKNAALLAEENLDEPHEATEEDPVFVQ